MGKLIPERPRSDVVAPDLTLPHVARFLRRTARAAGIIAPLVGVSVLVGWATGNEFLKRIVPTLTAMNPATAVGFIGLGLSLEILCLKASRWTRPVAVALALVPAVLGVSCLAAIFGLIDVRLDQWLFREQLAAADFGRPNMMAPNTAMNFILLGLALITIDRGVGRYRWAAQLLALVAAMSSYLALTGYAYGRPSLYGIGSQIAMSLPTAATFLVVSIGVLCARPTLGMMAVVSSRSSGGTMVRRVLPAVLLLPVALAVLHAAGQRVMLFDTALGVWLLVVAILTLLTVLVGSNALLLHRGDLERAATEQRLAHQATHDPLTRLPSRRLVIDSLRGAAGLLFIDLDLFKIINDSLGHVFGDELIAASGKRIEDCVGTSGVVGHLSGDEFTVALPSGTPKEAAIELGQKIRRAFDLPFTIGEHEVFTSVSIGLAVNGGGETPIDLLRHADIAMYAAKTRGRARLEVFDPSMDAAARERLILENDLRRALSRGELRVYYQPEVEIDTGRLVGMEALVRWQHPQRGMIAPAQFIAVAEETGLIVPIGRWVLLEACRQAKTWHTTLQRDVALMVSVNLSGKHLQQATLIDEVKAVLETTGIDPGRLIIEITETVAMAGAETTIEILKKLKALGVQLAIDDFGTGFSSLAYLKRFPVDLLKIDKSFVDGVALDGPDSKIVEAIIALGHALGMRVIAEGVETTAQLEELRALGSELGQGYFFGRPRPSHESPGS